MIPTARAILVALTVGIIVAGAQDAPRPPATPVVAPESAQAAAWAPHLAVRPVVAPLPMAKPMVTDHRTVIGGTATRGTATWYCCTKGYGPDEMVAAAGPALRVGSWRGRHVRVCSGGRCVTLVLRDWCQCYEGTSHERIIDVHPGVIRALGLSLSQGIYRVSVAW